MAQVHLEIGRMARRIEVERASQNWRNENNDYFQTAT